MRSLGSIPKEVQRPRPVPPRPRYRSAACFIAVGLAGLLTAGCGLYNFLTSDPREDIKEAATGISAEAKASAKEFGTGLAEAGEKYREELSHDIRLLAQSADNLVTLTKDSPAAISDAMTRRLLQDPDVQNVLKSVANLARSGEHFAAAAERGPALLAARLADIQGDLTRDNGFLSQQRTAIMDDLRKERVAIAETIRQERQEVMKDLDAFTVKMIEEVSAQLRYLISSALWLLILFVLVLWGLPFGAGVLVGRQFRRSPKHGSGAPGTE